MATGCAESPLPPPPSRADPPTCPAMTETTPIPDKPPERPRRPARDLLEGLGIALLMAVFFKYFAIEAYQIPTSSMQPTMMGSSAAGVYDRLIVDKFRYAMFEPQRWDIAVFKYPIRENQNYVKRIVGMPGDRLKITGGNIYNVAEGTDGSNPADLEIRRKPEIVQEVLWKEIFPARMEVTKQTTVLDSWFRGSGGPWSESEGTLTFAARRDNSTAKLTFRAPGGDGVENLVWDGYPASVAAEIRTKEASGLATESVQDVRMACDVTPAKPPTSISLYVGADVAAEYDTVDRTKISRKAIYRFAFEWEAGKGRIELTIDRKVVAASEPFDLAWGAGETHRIRLAHVDDRIILDVDGAQRADLDVTEHKILCRAEDVLVVTPALQVQGGGELTVADIVVERDLHYLPTTRQGAILPPYHAVPEGHYMMLGDNTLQSVDSRDWTKIVIGEKDGKLVNPKTHPEANILEGNRRPVALSEDPDPDENPVPIPSLGKVVFTDRAGEVWVLDGQINLNGGTDGRMWGGADGIWFEGENGPWAPEVGQIQFVPRDHIIGRPLLNFWPLYSPFRFGLIR